MEQEINAPGVVPSPALRMLAALPFPIIITTNYDPLFDLALYGAQTLQQKQKRPVIPVYRPGLNEHPEPLPLGEPSEENPILLKLHGSFDKPDSVVVTENDYLDFMQKMGGGDNTHPIRMKIRERLMSWTVLFIGYSLKDYNFRLLIRTLRWSVEDAEWRLFFSVDPSPDEVIALVSKREEKSRVSFIQADLWDFVPELYKKVTGKDWT